MKKTSTRSGFFRVERSRSFLSSIASSKNSRKNKNKYVSPVPPLWAGHGTPSFIPANLHSMLQYDIPHDVSRYHCYIQICRIYCHKRAYNNKHKFIHKYDFVWHHSSYIAEPIILLLWHSNHTLGNVLVKILGYILAPWVRYMHDILSCAMRVGEFCVYHICSMNLRKYTHSTAHWDTE